MKSRKRKRNAPFAAYLALIFNAALCIAPMIGARAVSTAFGEEHNLYDASSAALSATRAAIEDRFARLTASSSQTPRQAWADLVGKAIEAGDVAKVRGYLLAAPAMMQGKDGEALKALISVSDQKGEEAQISAALAYLPENLQETYKRLNTPISEIIQKAEQQTNEAGKLQQTSLQPAAQTGLVKSEESSVGAFLVLGDLRDLSMQAAKWVRGSQIDEFAFHLSGIGLTLADAQAKEGASVVLSARRAQRLDPKLAVYLERKIFEAAPPQRLKRDLTAALKREVGASTSGPVIASAFKTDTNARAVNSLLEDLRVVRDIAHETSPSAAVTILSHVRDGADLRRARLVAQAGGDRATALAHDDPDHFLDTATTVINWTTPLQMQLAGLAACFALLLLIAFTVFWRSVRRSLPVRRSAVYAYQEMAP